MLSKELIKGPIISTEPVILPLIKLIVCFAKRKISMSSISENAKLVLKYQQNITMNMSITVPPPKVIGGSSGFLNSFHRKYLKILAIIPGTKSAKSEAETISYFNANRKVASDVNSTPGRGNIAIIHFSKSTINRQKANNGSNGAIKRHGIKVIAALSENGNSSIFIFSSFLEL